MYDFSLIQRYRTKLGITQITLCHLSGVSLPTIQNIEAGKGNPSVKILEALYKALGIDSEVRIRQADWDYLSQLALPLDKKDFEPKLFNSGIFFREIKQACLEISESPLSERKVETLQALVLGIKNHFPTTFKNELQNTPVIKELLGLKTSHGRVIKLTRIAVSNLSRLL